MGTGNYGNFYTFVEKFSRWWFMKWFYIEVMLLYLFPWSFKLNRHFSNSFTCTSKWCTSLEYYSRNDLPYSVKYLWKITTMGVEITKCEIRGNMIFSTFNFYFVPNLGVQNFNRYNETAITFRHCRLYPASELPVGINILNKCRRQLIVKGMWMGFSAGACYLKRGCDGLFAFVVGKWSSQLWPC